MYDNKTTDNIESDDIEDEDKENTDAAEYGDFLRHLHQEGKTKDDFGTTANIVQR